MKLLEQAHVLMIMYKRYTNISTLSPSLDYLPLTFRLYEQNTALYIWMRYQYKYPTTVSYTAMFCYESSWIMN